MDYKICTNIGVTLDHCWTKDLYEYIYQELFDLNVL